MAIDITDKLTDVQTKLAWASGESTSLPHVQRYIQGSLRIIKEVQDELARRRAKSKRAQESKMLRRSPGEVHRGSGSKEGDSKCGN